MEIDSSSSSFNGDLSFLSLLMADESPAIQTSNQFLDLPPLPPSCFETSQSHFFSPPNQSSFIFPISEYFLPSLDFPDDDEVKPIVPASNLPELLSLENVTPPEAEQSDHRRKKQKKSRSDVSDRIYTLEKLLPAKKYRHRRRLVKADVLEEAHKYITWLKAQVSVLRSMPTESMIGVSGSPATGGLGRLSRRQLLEVVVNSPSTQAVMTEQGWCVVSSEQIALMKKIEVRKELIRQLLNLLPPL